MYTTYQCDFLTHSDIRDLNEIQKGLNQHVHAQGEKVERIGQHYVVVRIVN